MIITKSDELEIAQFVKDNPHLFDNIKLKEDGTENFFSVNELLLLIVGFCKNVADLDKGITSISKLLEKIKSIFKGKKEGKAILPDEERVLLLIFDSYIDSKSGLTVEKIGNYSGVKTDLLEAILSNLESKKIIRKTPAGKWMYNNRS